MVRHEKLPLSCESGESTILLQKHRLLLLPFLGPQRFKGAVLKTQDTLGKGHIEIKLHLIKSVLPETQFP